MRSRVAMLMLVAALATGGCKPAQQRTVATNADTKLQVLRGQVEALQHLLVQLPVVLKPEPTRDVSEGTFLGRIERVSTSAATPTFVIDFITDDMVPWAAGEDRARSSWPDFYGWNRIKHGQVFRIGESAALFVRDTGLETPLNMLGVSEREFARRWKADPDAHEMLYYVTIRGGKVYAMRPWEP